MEFDINQIAQMAKLRIPTARQAAMHKQLETLLQMLEGLPLANSTDVASLPEDAEFLRGALREDVVAPSLPQAQVLQSAPKAAGGYFALPKTME